MIVGRKNNARSSTSQRGLVAFGRFDEPLGAYFCFLPADFFLAARFTTRFFVEMLEVTLFFFEVRFFSSFKSFLPQLVAIALSPNWQKWMENDHTPVCRGSRDPKRGD